MGLSGSGKTTATEPLIDTTNVIRLRSDVERKRMHGLGLMDTSAEEMKSRMYSEQSTTAVYDRLKVLAAKVIDAGYSVIVDATFLKRSQRQSFVRLAESLGVPFSIIHCQANEDVLRERIRNRQAEGRDASEAGQEVLDSQLRIMELPDGAEAACVTIA